MRRTLMGTLGILLLASGLGLFGPWAEAQPKPAGQPASPLSGPKSGSQTEVTVDVRQGKLGLGMPNPVLVGLDPATVTSNFTDVLRRDLEDAGPFALLKDKLPTTVEASTVKPWLDAGAEWVLAIKVTKIGEVVTVALQVLDVKATAQGKGKQLRYAFSKNYTGNASLLRTLLTRWRMTWWTDSQAIAASPTQESYSCGGWRLASRSFSRWIGTVRIPLNSPVTEA